MWGYYIGANNDKYNVIANYSNIYFCFRRKQIINAIEY